MTDETLRKIVDERAIERLMADYAERIDANDPQGAAACFATDGIGVYWQDCVGREAIAERLTGILGAFHATSHHLSNIQINLNGDTATALSYVYAFHRYAGSLEPMHYWGRWVDELKREDGAWKFARREVVGVGSINPEGRDAADLNHPGHPDRLAP
jgi:uncharacterized protein (TIGR02246 family)